MTLAAGLELIGHGPFTQAAIIIVSTFVLEDAATVLTALAAQAGVVSLPVALGSLYAGIVLGDLGLYGLGRLSANFGWVSSLLPALRIRQGRAWLEGRVFSVVFVSRFIPGLRLPTYTACGFLSANFGAFLLAAVVATSIWTSLLFGVSLKVGDAMMHYLGAWRWAGIAGFVIVVALAGHTAARLQGPRLAGRRLQDSRR